jgi:hypothetical protein
VIKHYFVVSYSKIMGVVKPENTCMQNYFFKYSVTFVGHVDEVFLQMIVGVIAL